MNVIDFEAARQRLASPPLIHRNPILEALDALGVALADHGHTWTDRERSLYETAVQYLQSGGTEFRYIPGSLPATDPRIEQMLRPYIATKENMVEPFIRQWRTYKTFEVLGPGNDPAAPAISMMRESWERLVFAFENMPAEPTDPSAL